MQEGGISIARRDHVSNAWRGPASSARKGRMTSARRGRVTCAMQKVLGNLCHAEVFGYRVQCQKLVVLNVWKCWESSAYRVLISIT